MRRNVAEQLPLVPTKVAHPHARELDEIARMLEEEPRLCELVASDLLLDGQRADRGREGMSGRQVLAALLLKHLTGASYDRLAFHLADSTSYRRLLQLGVGDKAPSRSTLHANISQVREQTLEQVNRMLLGQAESLEMETATLVRTDCTTINVAIHHPTDNSLAWDAIRVLTRLTKRARRFCEVAFSDHRKRAKRRTMGISNAKSMRERRPLYRDLLKVLHKTIGYAEGALTSLRRLRARDKVAASASLVSQLERFIDAARQVGSQAYKRVFLGQKLSPDDKVVSLFETHTDIIIKDNLGDPVYGHKVCLSSGASGLVLDLSVERGNPNDATLSTKMMSRLSKIFAQPPEQAVFDGAFASRVAMEEIKAIGIRDVVFTKYAHARLRVDEMARDTATFHKLRKFRSGIEGSISLLKRSFGWARCDWRGFGGFCRYVWGAALSHNAILIARQRLKS